MSETRRDRIMAAGACFVLAAMVGAVAVWAWMGVGAAEADYQRFEGGRPRRDIVGFSMYLIPVAMLLSLASVGLCVLGGWMVVVRRGRG